MMSEVFRQGSSGRLGFGGRVRRHRTLVACLLCGALLAVGSVDHIRVVPPSFKPRATDIATAHTTFVVQPPDPIALDPTETVYGIQGLLNRAVLLGNLLASPVSRAQLAERFDVPINAVEITAPATPNYPLPAPDADHVRKVTDVLHYNDQYRLSISVNSTAPIVDVYSEAPTVRAAISLANASVQLLRAAVARAARASSTPAAAQVQVTQLGSAQGGITNPGASLQLAALAFLFGALGTRGLIALLAHLNGRRTTVSPAVARG